MKKLNSLLVALMLLIALPIGAFAENETVAEETTTDEEETTVEEEEEIEVEEVSEEDAKLFSDSLGAQIRVLQLERKLYGHILMAQKVSEYVSEANFSSVDSDSLESHVEDLEAILLEVESVDTSGEVSEVAKEYAGLKADAVEVVKAFREELRESLTDEEKAELKEFIEEAKEELREDETMQAYTEEIQSLKNEANANRLERKMDQLGIENQELLDAVAAGEVTLNQIKERVRAKYNELTPEQKERVKNKVKEIREEDRERIQERVDNLKERVQNARANQKERIQERKDERKDQIQQRVSERRDEIRENVKSRIEERRPEIEARIKAVSDRVRTTLENDPQKARVIAQRAENLRDKRPEDIDPNEVRDLIEEVGITEEEIESIAEEAVN